jgi:surfactin synthase thioesterase subunit
MSIGYYALEKYVYKKELGNLKLPVRCHLLTLGGSEDPTVSERHIVEWHNIVDTSEYNVEHHMFQNCGHFYWKNSPSNMQKLTQLLVNASVVSGDAGWDGSGEDNSVESISVKEEQDNDTI